MKDRTSSETPDDAVSAYVLGGGYELGWPQHTFAMAACSSATLTKIGEHVNAMLNERDRRGSSAGDDFVYLAALAHFGFGCPHPGHRQVYLAPGQRRCQCCDSFIVEQRK